MFPSAFGPTRCQRAVAPPTADEVPQREIGIVAQVGLKRPLAIEKSLYPQTFRDSPMRGRYWAGASPTRGREVRLRRVVRAAAAGACESRLEL
jgi:hypothetical protein